MKWGRKGGVLFEWSCFFFVFFVCTWWVEMGVVGKLFWSRGDVYKMMCGRGGWREKEKQQQWRTRRTTNSLFVGSFVWCGVLIKSAVCDAQKHSISNAKNRCEFLSFWSGSCYLVFVDHGTIVHSHLLLFVAPIVVAIVQLDWGQTPQLTLHTESHTSSAVGSSFSCSAALWGCSRGSDILLRSDVGLQHLLWSAAFVRKSMVTFELRALRGN